VFNAYEATRRCLDSLERHTPPGIRIVVVDDASTDERIALLLRSFAARRPQATVLANPRNQGFVTSANRGIQEAAGDAIVLNSDTEVTAGWVEGLLRCRRSDPAIGIVCPLSNNATLLSLEGVAELYRRADGSCDVDALGACVRTASLRSYVRLPTAVGVCMLVTRELRNAVGAFDPAFGRGYGEENDLSMRAQARGFQVACSDDVYVHHAGAASFGEGADLRAELARNQALLYGRWPGYAPMVAAWWRSNPLRQAIERVNAAAERERMPGRPACWS
jgi:GT2 family glycosyltransferase